MPLTLRDLIADPSKIEALRPPVEKCSVCGKKLQETITGKHYTRDGVMCSDHYYQKLGEGVEGYPIAAGGARRG